MITGRDRNYIRSQTFRMQPDVPVIHPPKLLLARALDAYEKGDLGAAPIANLYRTDLNTILQQLAPLPPIPDAEDSSEELPVL